MNPDDSSLDHEVRACMRLWAACFSLRLKDYIKEWRDWSTLDFAGRKPRWVNWFDSDQKHIGSFVWLCSLFGMDESQARSRVNHFMRKEEA